MNDILKTSQELRALRYSVIPVNQQKQPLVAFKRNGYTHNIPGDEIDSLTSSAWGIAVIAGAVSGNLICFDIDTKYDLSGDLATRVKNKLAETCPAVLKKSVIQRTVSGGFHFIVKIDPDIEVPGNRKLATRDCTPEELSELRKTNPKLKTAVRVLIETRGEGGYFLVAPSPGYQILKNEFRSIGVLTPSEYNACIATFRSFSESFTEDPVSRTTASEKMQHTASNDITPWDDYNNKTDGIHLLESYGWVTKGNTDPNTVKLLRPGKPYNSREHSAYYHLDTNRLVVFSSSTVFETEHNGRTPSYSPFGIYTMLEHNGDTHAAIEALQAKGFGSGKTSQQPAVRPYGKLGGSAVRNPVRTTTPYAEPDTSKLDDPDNTNTDIGAYIGDFTNAVPYLNMVRSGSLPEGMSVGHRDIDEFLRFKTAQFNIVHGLANVGKSTWMWFMAAVSAIAHGWRWVIYTGENDYEFVMRKIMETFVGKPMSAFSDAEFKSAENFIRQHFTFITNEHVYSFRDILGIAEELLKESHYNAIMIDPYNSLVVDDELAKKLRTIGGNKHDYDYAATTEMRVFIRRTGVSIYLNAHTGTDGARRVGRDPDKPPKMYEIEGGNKFASRADDFITVHRNTKNSDTWMYTDIHVDKIKVMETGGRPTPEDEPIKMIYKPSRGRFMIKSDRSQPYYDFDIFEYWKSGKPEVRKETKEDPAQYQNGFNNRNFVDDFSFSAGIHDEAPF